MTIRLVNGEFLKPIKSTKIFFILTCCLLEKNFESRKIEYLTSISQTLEICKKINNCQVLIVENNIPKEKTSFLEILPIPILYTSNNIKVSPGKKGLNELVDLLDVITFLGIPDDALIVKQTGRYFLNQPSEFIDCLKNFENQPFDAMVRYGSFVYPNNFLYSKINDCITGLIATRVFIIKRIKIPVNDDILEHCWARALNESNDYNIKIIPFLNLKANIADQWKLLL